MKFYVVYVAFSGVPGQERDISNISLFRMAKSAFFGSFFYMMFINLAIRTILHHSTAYFMNFMNIYVEGLFKRFCRYASFIWGGFMNFAETPFYIQVHNGGRI
jgi:hypothetical protein